MTISTASHQSTAPGTNGPVADLFSSYVAASAISTAHEIGLLDRLHADGGCPADEFHAPDGRVAPDVLRALLHALAWAGIVEFEPGPDGGPDGVEDSVGTAVPGPRFAEAYEARGYFYWLVRGCGTLFASAPDLSLDVPVRRYRRDMRAVAVGSRLIGDTEVEPLFDEILGRLDFGAVADIGCGSGQRLIRIVRRNPGTHAVGIDLAPASVELATTRVGEEGLADKITVVRGDVHLLTPGPVFEAVEVITCVFMGHDFWPFDQCVATLRRLTEVFPRAHTLLLCDVVRGEEVPGPQTPIFRLGFETAHALMDVYLPTLVEWMRAFEAAGWRCRTLHTTAAPPGGVLFELTPAGSEPTATAATATTADTATDTATATATAAETDTGVAGTARA